MEKHIKVPALAGLYWYFENGAQMPHPVLVDPLKHSGKFKSFNGSLQGWLADGEYLLGPQLPPAAQ